ncbi:hypothetical protein JXM67_03390 [candidate division WOR-3 bacterium]|nr:hypothetical protein [candidate division WOR-3 bacterium]
MKYINLILPVMFLSFLALVGCENEPPVIERLEASIYKPLDNEIIEPSDTVEVFCKADDPDYRSSIWEPDVMTGDASLDYSWETLDGGVFLDFQAFPNYEAYRYWEAPVDTGSYRIACTVIDNDGATDSDTLTIEVIEE